ncbi:uncharacterized protein BCR38DRAFT_404994 [Pseudomassariella vexata]|uniref:Uncharacterized protein n=1 Tax=Pseudomassariella vexata TaxID=1141098 RepID=A0A1Y2EK93_9PEZI|nr:uncharacterized protein BCR38DRAFT_404994 [Pseudomassariella vexata]ORY71973.1 hypothetical protein BCR38DRAFT_404994 [Pseudomassariella vexata]
MSSVPVDEKALKVNTIDLPSNFLTPTTTSNEKGSTAPSIELQRTSTVSSPSSATRLDPFDNDIEAMMPTSCENLNSKSPSCPSRSNKDCTVWPGQDHWKKKAKAAKLKNRSCQCMARLNKRNRIMAKILIAFLIIGAAVGVGLGISKSVGAGIWKPKEQ